MTDDAKGELLPCPFCGSAAHMVHLTELPDDDPNFGGAYIECTKGACAATTNIHFGEYDAILREKWNRRAALSAQVPREPTEAMIEAAGEAGLCGFDDTDDDWDSIAKAARAIWRAMHDAATGAKR